MKISRRTEVTLETHETTIIRFQHGRSDFCESCRARVSHFTPDEAGTVLSLSAQEINRLAETGQIHFLEPRAAFLLCGNSLAAFETKELEP